jgi:hypothetical protein
MAALKRKEHAAGRAEAKKLGITYSQLRLERTAHLALFVALAVYRVPLLIIPSILIPNATGFLQGTRPAIVAHIPVTMDGRIFRGRTEFPLMSVACIPASQNTPVLLAHRCSPSIEGALRLRRQARVTDHPLGFEGQGPGSRGSGS